MIDANPINEREQTAKAFDPPCIPGASEHIPTIVRIAPQLSGGTEVVGWHAGNHGRTSIAVELEQLATCPDIGAVVSDENRQISHDDDRACTAGLAHSVPLFREQELRELMRADVLLAARSPPLHRRRVMLRD